MKNKITQEINQQLKVLADKLPIMKSECYDNPDTAVPIRMNFTGDRILEAGGTAKDSEGKDIKPDNKYGFTLDNAFLSINHNRRLSKAFKANGWEGVDLYIKGIKSKFASTPSPIKPADNTEEATKETTGNQDEPKTDI